MAVVTLAEQAPEAVTAFRIFGGAVIAQLSGVISLTKATQPASLAVASEVN